ncbi:membrane protein [Oscillospiraceae bacterium]|nr:membrane protein [Oscillospiraceae bacterium]BDF76281.1 membrane protein [Oscillospiraceae bacterium]
MARAEGGRLAYADLLRVAAILAMVVLHIAGGWMAEVDVGSGAWRVFNVYNGLVRWCVPVFVMLSGMFLLDPKKKVGPGDLIFKYMLRVLAALLFWNFLYELFGHLLEHDRFTPALVFDSFMQAVWGKAHYHLWFLFMILGLYLITPVLRAFVRGASRGELHWFFAVTFVVACLLPTLLKLRPSATASAWLGQMQIHLVLGYVGFYVAGYYLKTYTLGRVAEVLIYVLGAGGAVATVWGNAALSARDGGQALVLYSYLSPNVVCMSVAVFVLFRYVLGLSEERSRRQRAGGLARISFGIYLVHDFFIMLLRHFGISTLSFAPALAVPALALGVFLCAALVAWPISKIPLVGKYLT